MTGCIITTVFRSPGFPSCKSLQFRSNVRVLDSNRPGLLVLLVPGQKGKKGADNVSLECSIQQTSQRVSVKWSKIKLDKNQVAWGKRDRHGEKCEGTQVPIDRNGFSTQYVFLQINAVFVKLYVEEWISLMNPLLEEMTTLQTLGSQFIIIFEASCMLSILLPNGMSTIHLPLPILH